MNVTRKMRDLLARRFAQRNFGQNAAERLYSGKSFMLLSFARKIALCCGLVVGIPVWFSARPIITQRMDLNMRLQVHCRAIRFPRRSRDTHGGFVVWQDNITDTNGLGISMMPVNGTLSGSGSKYSVNVQEAGDQENPRVALLQNGGAVFVWQGGLKQSQHIYARFLSSSGLWLTSDVPVNTFTNNFKSIPPWPL